MINNFLLIMLKCILSIILIASVGCSTKTVDLTPSEAGSLPSSGILTIYTPDLNLHKINPRKSFLFLAYGRPHVRESKMYVFIHIDNIKSQDILKIKIPHYAGLEVTSINFNYMYEKNRTVTGTYDVELIPVYNHDTLYMDRVRNRKIKTFQNNNIIEYSLGIKLQPNLNLNDLNSYLDHYLSFSSR